MCSPEIRPSSRFSAASTSGVSRERPNTSDERTALFSLYMFLFGFYVCNRLTTLTYLAAGSLPAAI